MPNADWETLLAEIAACERCPLHKTRTNPVPGKGNPAAGIMIIGEAPGADEDAQGLPFVGRAGKLLDRLLFAVDLTLDDVYIANILKCRPPANRDPETSESEACIPFLRRQTKLISPKVIMCLGRIAAMRLITPDFKITVQRGQWFERGGFHMCATFHPAALLRDPGRKGETLDDFKSLVQKARELGVALGNEG